MQNLASLGKGCSCSAHRGASLEKGRSCSADRGVYQAVAEEKFVHDIMDPNGLQSLCAFAFSMGASQ